MTKYVEVAFVPGDQIYVIRDGAILEMEIEYVYIGRKKRYHAKSEDASFNFRDPGVGRDVFYTKEAAEEALAFAKEDKKGRRRYEKL